MSNCQQQQLDEQTECGCMNIRPGEQHSCDVQKEWGKCQRSWMMDWGYCEVTCGWCQCFGEQKCTDIPPNKYHSCGEQKEWGKCSEGWMKQGDYCQTTCGRCDAANNTPKNPPQVIVQNRGSFSSQQNAAVQQAEEAPQFETAAVEISPPSIESTATTTDRTETNILEENVTQNEKELDDRIIPDLEQEPAPSLLDISVLAPPLLDTPSPTPILDPTPLPSPSTSPTPIPAPTPLPSPSPSPLPTPVQRVCECDDKPPGRSLTCAQQKALGKCMRGWMLSGNHCAITCGRCHCVEDENGDNTITCMDNPPSKEYSCADQLRYGKCDEPWIVSQGYCQYTCDRCEKPQQQQDNSAQSTNDVSVPSMLQTSDYVGNSLFSMQSTRVIQPPPVQPTPQGDSIPTMITDSLSNAIPVPTTQVFLNQQAPQVTQSIPPIAQNILSTPQIVIPSSPELAFTPDETTSSPQIEIEDDFSMTLISSTEDFFSQSNSQNQQSQYNPLGMLAEDYDDGYNPQILSGYSGGYNPRIFSVPQNDNTTLAADSFQIQYRQYTNECSGSINQEIAKRPFLSILSQLLPRTGLASSIQDTIGGVTLFAPRDDAFRAFASENDITLQDLFVNPTFSEGILPKLLAYHVVPRKLSGRSLAIVTVSDTMLAGEDNLIFVKSANPLVIEGRASEAEVVEADIIACDGIIHILDGVLLPVQNLQLLVDDSNLGGSIIEPRLIAPPAPNSQIQVPVGVPINQRSIEDSPMPISSLTNPEDVVLESRASAIGQNEPDVVDSSSQSQCRNVTVLDILENLPDTEILFRMVQELNLEKELQSPITFFAPVDDALEQLALKLGFSNVNDLFLAENTLTVLNILFFHMIPQAISLDEIDPNVPIPNINGSLLYLSKEDSNDDVTVTIQEIGSQAKVIDADSEINFGCNISLYLVDTALLPFTIIETTFPDMGDAPLFAPPPPPIPQVIPEQVLLTAPQGILDGLVPQEVIDQTRAGQRTGAFVVDKSSNDTDEKKGVLGDDASVRSSTRCPSVLDVLRSREDLTLMNALIMHAGLDPLLNDTNSELTVFVPTDKAFQTLVEKLGARSQSLTNHEVLGNILGYHIVRDAIEMEDFEIGLELPTLVAWLGNSLSLLIEENDLGIVTEDAAEEMIIVGIGSEAQILEFDISACESVIHIVDTVLLPVDTQ